MSRVASAAIALIFSLYVSAPTSAQSYTSTLKKIADTGTLVIGYDETAHPFSFAIDGKPVGYSIDICARVAETLKQSARLKHLKVVYAPVTVDNRFDMVKQGKVDMECVATTNNLERQRSVAFSVTTFVAGSRLLSRKDSSIRALFNLKNKSVVALKNTTSLEQLVDYNHRYRYNMTILQATDEPEAMQMLQDGRAVAFAYDDVIIASLIANQSNPKEWAMSIQALSVEPYAMMMRRGDPAFKRAVDDAITTLFHSGEIYKIYSKWFTSPIPPKGINLNFPVPDVMEKVIKRPTDSGNPATYHL